MTSHLLWLLAAVFPGVSDTPFVQETRAEIAYPAGAGEVRSLAVDASGAVWIASRAGLHRHAGGAWKQVTAGSTYAVAASGNSVWAGAWDGLYRITQDRAEKIADISGPVAAVHADARGVAAAAQDSIHTWDGLRWRHTAWRGSRAIRGITRDSRGALWVATKAGLYRLAGSDLRHFYREDHLLSPSLEAVALSPDGRIWAGGVGGLDVYAGEQRASWYDHTKGMPNPVVRCLAIEPDGTVWAGTEFGAARLSHGRWSWRHSRRWLPGDGVRGIAFDGHGTAWVATTRGLSAIRRRRITLADKAEEILRVCLSRHVRPPYLVEKCLLRVPGDVSTFAPVDDDNDGQYTAMYLAMESYRYAATRDPRARENARRAFHALEFLETVTGTPGLVARTVIPSTWTRMADPNETFTPEALADRRVEDPRNKPVAVRWHPSADGKWLWKGDTSSDEITGHFYGYLIYYDLAADEAERARMRGHLRRVMNYIIDGGYTLKDMDGLHTRWGVWSPEKLYHDPDWIADRRLNSLEILSFLKATYHMTGDEKYQRQYLELLDKHGYRASVNRPRALEAGVRTYIDDELLALAIPALVLHEGDAALGKLYRQALAFWFPQIRDDHSPYYNFVYAALAGSRSGAEFGLAGCVEFLRDAPLDLVEWTVDNRRREDVRLVRRPVADILQTDRLLPASERAIIRWDRNPRAVLDGRGGRTESSGVYWLLPYWMGRCYGFIQAPE